MKKLLLFIFIAASLLMPNLVNADETSQLADDYNNLYYPKSIYNDGINFAPQAQNQAVYVNTATGSVNVLQTDVTLPGRNGFDLSITRMYSSSNASLYEPQIVCNEQAGEPEVYYMIYGLKRTFIYYTDNSYETTDDVVTCLKPSFFDYLETKDAEWMIRNASSYEFLYNSEQGFDETLFFSSEAEANAAIAELESTLWQIDAYFPYDNTVEYKVDYYSFVIEEIVQETVSYEAEDSLNQDTGTERYSMLGTGWEFTFPYVEVRYGYDYIYEYLHFGEKGVWQIDFSDGGSNNLVGYNLNDIVLTEDRSITHDGKTSKYCVTEKDGTKHYFASDGRLLIQQDRYGNQIKFYCGTRRYLNAWGNVQQYPYITKIVDTMGREISFVSENDSDIEGQKYIKMTISDPTDTDNVKVYSYNLSLLTEDDLPLSRYTQYSYLDGEEWVLSSVSDPEGNTDDYSYAYETTRFSFLNRNRAFYDDFKDNADYNTGNSYITENDFLNFGGKYNCTVLLKQISGTGKKWYCFEYSLFAKSCTADGSMLFYKAYESHEEKVYDYNDNYVDMNKKTYHYDTNDVGEYDGYPFYKREEYIGDSYNYEVIVNDKGTDSGKSSSEIYHFRYSGINDNKTILVKDHTSQGTDHKVVTNNTYDGNTLLLTNTTVKSYSASNNSNYMTVTNSYTYDSGKYGDLLTHIPNGESDRAVTYTYDETYHFPLTKVYKQDANTTVREEYVPASNGKSIEFINVYVNDVLKSKTQYAHDSYGNIVNEKKYINSTDYIEKQYTYDNGAYLTNETVKNVTDNDNENKDISVSASYDYWGNPISQTDAEENTTLYEYDAINRLTKITNPDNSSKAYRHFASLTREYDELNNETTVYYTRDKKIDYLYYDFLDLQNNKLYYDKHGNIEAEVLYSDNIVLDEYGDGCQAVERETLYTYDTLQRPLTKKVYDKTGALVYHEEYAYEVTANYTKETVTVMGNNGNPSVVTSVYYDKFGNKIKTETGDSVETYTSDYAGNVLTVKSAKANAEGLSSVRSTEYDFMGNAVKETDELGNSITAEYDRLGRITKTYDANGYATEYKYDNMGRVIEQKTPFEEKDGTVYYSVKKNWYDGNGNVVKERIYTNASGETESYSEVKYTYDNRNRLVMTETNDGSKSNYVQNYYDAKGNLLRVYTGLSSPLTINGLDDVTESSDSEYAVVKYTYDQLDRLLTSTDALGLTETNTYDTVNGLLQTSTDRKGQTFNFSYNGLGNVTSKALSDGTNAETTLYGLTGQVVAKQNGTTAISYVYNNKGQLIQETDSSAGTSKTYTYDANGNRTGFTLTRNGNVEMSMSYTYDLLNRLTSVRENGTVIAQYSYDNKGNRIQTVNTDGETTSYTYNLANMLTSQTTGDKLSEQYSYYLNGNQKSKTSKGVTTTYEYDKMNRLIKENDTVYTFDDFGNRATMTDSKGTAVYSYDLNNRLTSALETTDSETSLTNYFYDSNGNTISRVTVTEKPYKNGMTASYTISGTSNEDVALYEYNCYNQLVGLNTNGIVSSYNYAPDGLRYSKTVGSDTTAFVYDNANIIEEITSDGINKYYRGIEIIKNDDGLYYIYNGQGDVSILTDNSGTTIADYTFDAYGNQQQENAVYNPFGYRGEYTDSESGLIYLRARMYDPETGRFINEDPIKDGYNWYIYCTGNPVMFVDPFGMEYGKLRDFLSSYATMFPEKPTIEFGEINGKGFAGITMGNYFKAFYFDGTIVADKKYNYETGEFEETRIKIADNIDGTLYMQRSAFLTAMGMTKDGTAQITISEPLYVNTSMAMLDLATHVSDALSTGSDVKDLYDLIGKAPVIGSVLRNAVAFGSVSNKLKNGELLSSGQYLVEDIIVSSPHKPSRKHQVTTLYGNEQGTSYYQYVEKLAWYGWYAQNTIY